MAASPTIDPVDSARKVPFGETRASVLLDAIRGIAAVLVTFEHLCFRLAFAQPSHPRHPWAVHAAFTMTELGHSAVIIFFVLSGFLVGGSLLRAYENNSWSWSNYLTHRFVRLWIVLIPALLIGLLWDTLSIHIAHSRINPQFVNARAAETAASLGFLTFVGNVSFLQDLLVPVFGSNGPLWSLRNEFWYYIMFPLGFFALMPKYSRTLRIIFGCCLVLLLVAQGRALDLYAPLWLFGALLYYVKPPQLSESTRRAAIALYIVAFFILVKLSFHSPLVADYLLAASTTALIWVILSARSSANPRALITRGSRLLARFSYTLYLIHVPIFTLAGILLVREEHWQLTPAHLIIAFLIWLTTILFALLVASFTEFRTEAVRHRVQSLFRSRPRFAPRQG